LNFNTGTKIVEVSHIFILNYHTQNFKTFRQGKIKESRKVPSSTLCTNPVTTVMDITEDEAKEYRIIQEEDAAKHELGYGGSAYLLGIQIFISLCWLEK